MDPLQWFATLGVGGILAGVMFYFYRALTTQFTEYVKQQLEHQRDQTLIVVQVVKENTESNTRLVTMIDAMHRRLDDEQRPLRTSARPSSG